MPLIGAICPMSLPRPVIASGHGVSPAWSLSFSLTACNLLRPGESYAGIIDLPMKPFYQFAAAVMLLLFFGVTGADCLVPNAQMSAAEKACCHQMAGQCDMDMAAKHPCCQKLVQRHDDADVNDLSHSAPPDSARAGGDAGIGLFSLRIDAVVYSS